MTLSPDRIKEIAAIRDEDIDTSDIPEQGEAFFSRAVLPLAQDQEDALRGILDHIVEKADDLVGLFGYSGTGKTFTMRELKRALEAVGFEVMITATTHPAAAVLRSLGLPATTIHSAAGLMPQTDGSKGYRRNPRGGRIMGHEIVIVDEASMADGELLEEVYRLVGGNGALVLVGDPAQLPPVAGGPTFDKWLEEAEAPTFSLTEVKRTSGDNPIPLIAEVYRDTEWAGQGWPSVDIMGEDGGFRLEEKDAALDRYFARDEPDPTDALVVAYTNAEVDKLNYRGRLRQFGDRARTEPFIVGERLIANAPVIDPNEGVILNNGQIVRVREAKPYEGGLWELSVQIEEYEASGTPTRATLISGKALARELHLSAAKEEAEASQELLYATIREYFGAPAANRIKAHAPDRRRMASMLCDLTDDLAMLEVLGELDHDRRGAWQQFFKLKNSLADLRPLWACTVHKSQGRSVENEVLILKDDVDRARDDWRALVYVAMTRTKRITTLLT